MTIEQAVQIVRDAGWGDGAMVYFLTETTPEQREALREINSIKELKLVGGFVIVPPDLTVTSLQRVAQPDASGAG